MYKVLETRMLNGLPAVAAIDRRQLLLAGAGLVTLSGCGLAADPQSAEGGEREIDTAFGKVKVPESPQQIVALDYFPGLTLIDVGITPAGVIDYANAGDVPERYKKLKSDKIRGIGQNGQPDLEALQSIGPDLIISQTYPAAIEKDKQLYEQLKSIAPTAVFAVDWQAEWVDKSIDVADAAGKRHEIEQLEDEVADRVDEITEKYSDVLGSTKWAQVTAGDGGAWVLYPSGSSLGALFELLGIELIDEAGDLDQKGGKSYSLETVEKLNDADVVIYPIGYSGQVAPEMKSLLENNQWKATNPAKKDHVFGLKHSLVSAYGWVIDALDELENAVLAPLQRR